MPLPPYVEAKPPILVRAWVRGFQVDAQAGRAAFRHVVIPTSLGA